MGAIDILTSRKYHNEQHKSQEASYSLSEKRAIFLDRDGVINDGNLVHSLEQLKVFDNAAGAIRILNEIGLYVIVVTNQPVVARGLCNEETVKKINEMMVTELAKKGARIDAIYYCPHHPEQRYRGNPEYRIECSCRKPKIGMLEKAAREFNLDLKKFFFIGDSMRDMKTAENAGCIKILVKTGHAGSDTEFKTEPDFVCKDILDAANVVKKMVGMKALILAGGLGKRMLGLTKDAFPKTMLPINGKPILQHQIELLKKHDIKNIILCTGHLSKQIEEYFGDGKKFGVKIEYSRESEALDTGGAIKNTEKFVSSTFIVLCGDIFLDMNIRNLIGFHIKNNALATMVLHETDHPQDSTIVQTDRSSRIIKIFRKNEKKPITMTPFHCRPKVGLGSASRGGEKLAKSSIYVLEPKIFDFMPEGRHNFEDEVLPLLLKNHQPLYGYVTNELVRDIGTPERYSKFS